MAKLDPRDVADMRAAGALIDDAQTAPWEELVGVFEVRGVMFGIASVRASKRLKQVPVSEVAISLGHRLSSELPASVVARQAAAKAPAEPAEGITAAVEKVTPGHAMAWLLKSEGNRALRRSHIAWLADQMREGSWEVTGQAIVFAAGGRLLDGHHRLQAVIDAGCTVSMLVVRGIPRTAWGKIDCGVPRAVHDRLTVMENPRQNRRAIEVIQQLRRIEKRQRTKVTSDQVRNDFNGMKGSMRAVLAMFPTFIRGVTRAQVLGAIIRYHQRDPERAERFAAQLRDGAPMQEGPPAMVLRAWLIGDASAGFHGTQGAEEVYWRTAGACLSHERGQSVKAIARVTSWEAA
jgi:hypothetical protein